MLLLNTFYKPSEVRICRQNGINIIFVNETSAGLCYRYSEFSASRNRFCDSCELFAMIEIHTSVLEPTSSERDRIIATPLYNGSNKNTIIPLISPKRGSCGISPAYPHELRRCGSHSAVAFLSLQRYHPFLSSDVQAEKSLVRE